MSLESTVPNLLELLGVAGREDVVTNILAHCYNSSAAFRPWFLRAIGVTDAGDNAGGTAYTRVQVGDAGAPDLVVVDHDGSGRSIILVENKLMAGEGEDQTKRYSSRECLRELAARFRLKDNNLDARYVFLTLVPDVRPGSAKFVPVSYDAFLRQRLVLSAEDGLWVPEFSRAWLELLARFYGAAQLNPDDCLLDRLRDSDALEGSYLAFRSFMRSVPCPKGMSFLWSSRSSQPGRRYYFAQFGKASWHPGKIDQSHERWRLNPATCFNIHVEPQFSVLDGKFSVALHYETNPYLSHKEAKKSLRQKDYDAYRRRRDEFIGIFRTLCPDDLKVGGRWNQVAKANLSLETLSVDDCKQRLAALLTDVSRAVDKALEGIDASAEPV